MDYGLAHEIQRRQMQSYVHHEKNKNKKKYKNKYTLNELDLQKTTSDRDLGVIISNDLKWTEQCETSSAKANSILGMFKRTFTYWNVS